MNQVRTGRLGLWRCNLVADKIVPAEVQKSGGPRWTTTINLNFITPRGSGEMLPF